MTWALRRFLVCLAAVLSVAALPADAGPRRPVVVELFTSQGCSSCPPADAFLSQLAERKDVLAMSLPVTYWDMLGWKDTLASEGNTRRQKAYAAAMGRGGIYTPQMIVDGVTDVVGSREAQVEAAIAARAGDMHAVPITVLATGDTLHITIGAASERQRVEATVWLFHILTRASVDVMAGENQGRNLVYRNVVRDVRPVGLWKGLALSLDLPRSDQISAPHDAVAVLLQEGGYGRILGAAFLAPPKTDAPH
jgi:hypothetical protein